MTHITCSISGNECIYTCTTYYCGHAKYSIRETSITFDSIVRELFKANGEASI